MDAKALIKTHWKQLIPAIIALAIAVVVGCCLCFPEEEESGGANVVSFDKTLPTRIKALLPDDIGDHLGLYVYDLTADKEVFAYRYDKLMSTASNMKILTTLTLLNQRGLTYDFCDRLYYNGVISKGILYGDICMKFGYNPEFNGDSLASWTSAIGKAGIKKVKGHILIDTPLSNPLPVEEHWEHRDFKYYYANPVFLGSKMLADSIAHYLTLGKVDFDEHSIMSGKVPVNSHLLRNSVSSMNLSLFNVLNHSSNIDAECLMYTLGRESVKDGDFRGAGIEKMKLFIFNEMQQNADKVAVIHDGCGLCPEDKMTPYFIVQLLQYAYSHKGIYNFLQNSFAVAGKSGTLSKRMKDTPAMGKVKAKTGRLTREGGVSGLSGYAVTKNGHLLAFSCLTNGIELTKAKKWEEELCLEFVK